MIKAWEWSHYTTTGEHYIFANSIQCVVCGSWLLPDIMGTIVELDKDPVCNNKCREVYNLNPLAYEILGDTITASELLR